MKTSNIFEQNPNKTIVAIVLIALLIIDITAANLYKLFLGYEFYERNKIKIERSQRIEKEYRIASDIYHHDLAKNIYFENGKWGGKNYTVATDSLGFKSEKPKDTPMISKKNRIVFIGDSFTEGIGLQHKDTFVGRIADILSERNIEVLNAAVASYSPIIYYRKIKHFLDRGLKFDELVVFIDISDIEDEALKYEMSQSNTVKSKTNKVKNTIRNNSIITNLLVQTKNAVFYKKGITDKKKYYKNRSADKNLNLRRAMWTIEESIFKDYGDVGLKKAEYYMNQLYHLLKLNNVALTIAVYPWPDQIINNDLNSIQVKYWMKWALQKQVNFLNYFPCFINQSLQKQSSNLIAIEKYFTDGDVHWNEEGHKLIASEFISFYNRQNCECAEQIAAPDDTEIW